MMIYVDRLIDDAGGRSVTASIALRPVLIVFKIGMLMFIIANLVGSTIQITTLPLPVLSTLQAVFKSKLLVQITP